MDLIARLRNSDKSAFNEIFHQYSNYVYKGALTILNDHNLAYDVMQDVFCHLWAKRKTAKILDLKNYFYLLVRRFAIDLKRHRAFDIYSDVNLYAEEPDNSPVEPYDSPVPDEDLNDAIDALPIHMKRIMILRFKFGRSAKEIRELTGLSISHIRNTSCAAVKVLRNQLKHV